MLSCKEVAEQASDHIDQHLRWDQRLRFKLHLLICRNCRRYVAQLRCTIESLQKLPIKQTPQPTEQHKLLASRLREQARKQDYF
ncbi:anti-sigma factor family protein [Methylophaga sp. OBS3]|uniref:anti-sigma factor family protein n=1 Tax=Methylophaga sp. OBS3 TaxID=2991934 RepID=UPI0022548AEA|nr:zf-HC2 domain-containing protein [Methylophaga sp. OBS3]MCX4189332.1 zf-HC2 domain-containing protein [Methylophaga sp. OBS3]